MHQTLGIAITEKPHITAMPDFAAVEELALHAEDLREWFPHVPRAD
jgi:hypothetical protein